MISMLPLMLLYFLSFAALSFSVVSVVMMPVLSGIRRTLLCFNHVTLCGLFYLLGLIPVPI